MAQLSPILTTARDILKENGNKPMHVNDIAEAAVRSARNQQMPADEFAARLSGALAAHLKLKTSTPIFTKPLNKNGRPQKGIYRLKQQKIPAISSIVSAPEINTDFMGKAGEHSVMGELLFWGYNASLMTVDDGIDIVASKNSKYFHIQVKTSTERSQGSFSFLIKKKSFELHHAAQTYYVFSMRKNLSCQYAVLPSSHIENLRMTNVIGGQNDLSITISSEANGKRFALNGSDITGWINNFGVIK